MCQVDVFGAGKGETGMPQVAHGYRVLAPDGSELTSHPESVIRPTSLGALSRTFGFSLEAAEPGDYVMVMTFRDELAGKMLELREPFRVLPPVPSALPPVPTTLPPAPSRRPSRTTAGPGIWAAAPPRYAAGSPVTAVS